MRIGAISILLAVSAAASAATSTGSLIGQKPPPWSNLVWLTGEPLPLAKLEGKVVLIRWWTAPQCPYCRATAPALKEFREAYRESGFEIIGVYHHKSPEPLTHDAVKHHAQRLGFDFPLAIDPEWRTLRQWWLDRGEERWTSVSFLLDRHGVVRHIHPGGQYVKGDADYAAMKAKIEELLAEK
jgi:peroxiredoxin